MSVFDGLDEDEQSKPQPWYVKVLTMSTALFMFLVAVVMFADVVGRYVFNTSIEGGFEIIGFLLGILLFSAYPLITRDEEHITVGLLDNFFHGWAKKIRDVGVLIGSIAVIGFMTFRLWSEAEVLRVDGEIGEYLDIEVWPFSYIIAGLSLVAALVLIRPLINTWRRPVDADEDVQPEKDDSLI